MEKVSKRQCEKMIYKMTYCYKNKHYRKATIYSKLLRIIFSVDIMPETQIGQNVEFIHNGLGCVIHPKTIINNKCKIYQNVTLGGNGKIVNGKTMKGAPILEENVAVFAGACVLGPITIGHDSIIGANAVITKDVPPNSLVYGNPANVTELKFKYDFK